MNISIKPSPKDDNPLNEVITLSNIWRCGDHLYKSHQGDCQFLLDINTNHDKRIYSTVEMKNDKTKNGTIRINFHPDCPNFHKMVSVIETISGHGCWKYEYGEDKFFVLDMVLTQELAKKLSEYRLTF